MKKIKKVIGYTMSLVMLAAGILVMPAPVKAADASDFPLVMQTDSTGLNVNDEVTVTFSVKGSTAIAGFDGYLKYDTDVLSFYTGSISCTTDQPTETDAEGSWICTYDSASQKISLNWSGVAAVTPSETTKLLTLKLQVKKSAASTTVSFQNPTLYLNAKKTQTSSYSSGLAVSITNAKAREFTIETDNVSGNADIAIPIRVTKNGGFSKLNLVATYDSKKLVFDSATVADSIKSKVIQGAYTISGTDGQVVIPYTATADVADTGTLVTLNFKVVSQTTTTGTTTTGTTSQTTTSGINTTTIRVAAEDVTSTAGDYFVVNAATATVFITEAAHVLGDVNGDDKINLIDVLYVMRYYNGAKVLADVEKTAADVNKNGTVDLTDAVLIMQYYNGAIKSF